MSPTTVKESTRKNDNDKHKTQTNHKKDPQKFNLKNYFVHANEFTRKTVTITEVLVSMLLTIKYSTLYFKVRVNEVQQSFFSRSKVVQ